MPSSKLGKCLIKIICSKVLLGFRFWYKNKLYYERPSTHEVSKRATVIT